VILTIEDVMSTLRIGRASAYRAIKSGEIPSFKIGKLIRVSYKALQEAIAKE